MSFNYSTFRTVVAPEFSSMSDAEILDFANVAKCQVSVKCFGCRYDYAWGLMTAHLIKVSKLGNNSSGAVGELKRTKVGQLEREYATDGTNASKDSFNLTKYGKEFVRLRKQNVKSPVFVSG